MQNTCTKVKLLISNLSESYKYFENGSNQKIILVTEERLKEIKQNEIYGRMFNTTDRIKIQIREWKL